MFNLKRLFKRKEVYVCPDFDELKPKMISDKEASNYVLAHHPNSIWLWTTVGSDGRPQILLYTYSKSKKYITWGMIEQKEIEASRIYGITKEARKVLKEKHIPLSDIRLSGITKKQLKEARKMALGNHEKPFKMKKCEHDFKDWGIDPSYTHCRKCGKKLPVYRKD